jgi:hypothetical protein
LNKKVVVGDIVRLGPSTASANPGAEEYKRAETSTQNFGTINSVGFVALGGSGTIYAYNEGDPISIVGTGMPEGWDYGYWGIVYQPDDAVFKTIHSQFPGYKHKTNNQVISSPTYYTGGGSDGTHIFQTYLRDYHNLNGVVYRIGVIKRIYDKVGASNFVFAWVGLELGMCYLTHASMTSGEAAGVYTISENPVSYISTIDHKDSLEKTEISQIYKGNLSSKPLRQWNISYKECPLSFIQDLEVLQRFQNQGYLLMFEPDAPGEYPIFGMMDFKYSFPHWDDTLCDVDFIFKGV